MSIINNKLTRLLTYSQIKQISPDYRSIHRTNEIHEKILNKFSEHLSSEPLTPVKFDKIKDEFFELMILLDQNMSRGTEEIEIPDNFQKFQDLLPDLQIVLTHKNTYNTCLTTQDTKLNLGFGFFKYYGTKNQFSYADVNYTTRAENLIKYITELSLVDIEKNIPLVKINDNPEPIKTQNQILSQNKFLLIDEHNKKVNELQALKEKLSHYQANLQSFLCALKAPVDPKKDMKKLFPNGYNNSNSDKIIFNKNEQIALKDMPLENIIKAKEAKEAKENNIQALIKNIIELQENIKSLRIVINTPENTISETLDTLSSNQIGEDYSINMNNLFIQPSFKFITSSAHYASSHIKNFAFGFAKFTGFLTSQNSSENEKPENQLLENDITHTVTALTQATDETKNIQVIGDGRQDNFTTPSYINVITTKDSRIEKRKELLLKITVIYDNLILKSKEIKDKESKKLFNQSIHYFKTLIKTLEYLNAPGVAATTKLVYIGSFCISSQYISSIMKIINENSVLKLNSSQEANEISSFKTEDELNLKKLFMESLKEIVSLLTDNNSTFNIYNILNIDETSLRSIPNILEIFFNYINNFDKNQILEVEILKQNFNKSIFNLIKDIYINRKKIDLNSKLNQAGEVLINTLQEQLKTAIKTFLIHNQKDIRVFAVNAIIKSILNQTKNNTLSKEDEEKTNKIFHKFFSLKTDYSIKIDDLNIDKIINEYKTNDNGFIKEDAVYKIKLKLIKNILHNEILLLKDLEEIKILNQNSELYNIFHNISIININNKYKEDFIKNSQDLLNDKDLIAGMVSQYNMHMHKISDLKKNLVYEHSSLDYSKSSSKIFNAFLNHYIEVFQSSNLYSDIMKSE